MTQLIRKFKEEKSEHPHCEYRSVANFVIEHHNWPKRDWSRLGVWEEKTDREFELVWFKSGETEEVKEFFYNMQDIERVGWVVNCAEPDNHPMLED